MSQMFPPLLVLLLRFFLLIAPECSAAAAPSSSSLAKCPTKCGNITVPYPFGTAVGCFAYGLQMSCIGLDGSTPRLVIAGTTNPEVEVTDLSLDTITIKSAIARQCANASQTGRDSRGLAGNQALIDLRGLPYFLSQTRNRFFVVGCAAVATATANASVGQSGCATLCADQSQVANGTCEGLGCCYTAFAEGTQRLLFSVDLVEDASSAGRAAVSRCGYAFVADREEYVFQMTDLFGFARRSSVPAVLDWSVGSTRSCADKVSVDYACGNHTRCVDSTNGPGPGYKCACDTGYHGNPYLADGCQGTMSN